MQVTETLAEGLKRQYLVTLPATEITQKMERRLTEIAGTLKLPGFRPGKVPMALLKQRFGSSVMGEVLEQSVQDSSARAIADRGLRPALAPKIEITKFEEGGALEYTMAFETLPEIPTTDFTQIALERVKAEVGDEEILRALDRLREQNKRAEPLEETRPAVTGDVVAIDYEGRVDGVAFDGGKGADQVIELGSGTFIPGFEDQLVGITPGETRVITVTFPEDYGAKNLAGKQAEFTVTAKGLRQHVLPELDEAFGQALGFAGLDALRDAVREQIEREFAGATRMRLKRALLDVLAGQTSFVSPEALIDAEFEQIWAQVEAAREQGTLEPEVAAKSEDERRAEYRGIAERRVRLGLLLSEVGRQNNIQVAEDELRRAAVEEARRYPGQERQVLEFFRQNRDALERLKAPLFEEKVVDFILEMAKLTDRVVTPTELFAEAAPVAA